MSDKQINLPHLSTQTPFLIRKDFLKQHVLHLVKNKTTLEVGCFDGYISSVIAEHSPSLLILLEPGQRYLNTASAALPNTNHRAICGDMHLDLNRVGKVDVALLLGVIYHSPAPLHVLEQLVTHCDPDHVVVDNPGNLFEWVHETHNVPGNRHTLDNYKSCGITSRINDEILTTAMHNLGYTLVWRKTYPQGSMSQHAPIFNFVKKNTSQNILKDYNE